MDISWLDKEGISTKDGIGYTGSEEKYISALQRFFKGYETNRKTVEETLAASDCEGYCIKVHSLKSNSKMIGASALSKAFEELENASRNHDTDLVISKTSGTLDLYKNVIELIRPIGETEAVRASGEISADEAKETASQLLEALDDCDDERSSELANKLTGYPFRITQKEKLKKAIDLIADFLYDEAADLIKEIIPDIE